MQAKEPRFDFADIHDVTVFADNVLPAVLRKVAFRLLDDAGSVTKPHVLVFAPCIVYS